jgi:glycosyltransferase involved in cell wall biosynthesis
LNAKWPWLAFFHGSTNENWRIRLYNRIDRILLFKADRLVVMSEWHRQMFGGIGRVRLIHNASLPNTAEGNLTCQFLPEPNQPRLAVIGRLSPEKGVDVLLKAVALRLRAGTPLSVIIAGDGPERGALERQAHTLGISENVHFLGMISDLALLYRNIDLVVIPSRSEGLPNVLLEALRFDVPVVATAVGAVPEVLRDQAAGEIVAPQDPDALAEGIDRALRTGRSSAAQAARAAATERFSLRRRVANHLNVYAELCAGRLLSADHRNRPTR